MTPTLGDFFPSELKEAYTDHNITPGSVFRLFSNDTNPPKIKRFVVLGIDSTSICVGILYINSEINVNIFPTEYLKSLHLPIQAKECAFLDHDSFLDCSHIYEIPFEKLKQEFLKSSDIFFGNLGDDDLAKAMQIVASAKTISPKNKKKYNILS